MSRFFATGSDSESESSSEEEQIVRAPLPTFTFSEDEEETKRVVRSTKEKRYEELTGIIKNLRNYKKIKDMPAMLTSFEELQKAYTKAAPVVLKEEGGIAPRFFIRCLVECDDFISQVWEDRDGRKNMSKGNSKALASLRQKLRKYTKDFEADMAKFREQPDLPDDEDEQKESSESDSEEERVKEDTKRIPDVIEKEPRGESRDVDAGEDRGSDSDSDSMDWGSSTSSSGSSDEDDDKYASIRERFLKRATERGDAEDDGERERRREKRARRDEARRSTRRKQRDDADPDGGAAGGGWETVRKGASAGPERADMFAPDAEVDTPLVVAKLAEVSAARGRKRTDRRAQLSLLGELRIIAEKHRLGPALQLKLRAAIVSAIFDYNLKVSDAMKPDHWGKLTENVGEMVNILLSHDDMIISETFTEDNEELVTPPYQVRGCVLTALERMDDEFAKLLKECDPHSNEYVERLKDEPKVVELIDRVLEYEEKKGTPAEICRIYLRKVEHLYYKFDQKALDQKAGKVPREEQTSVLIMEKLCKFIYSNDATDRLRTRAILAHIYHHALHDNWFQARDLLLMSHLQETVHHSDPSTQILYNRTMANLGLCAFRRGDIKDAHGCLVDLMMTGKPKELLAQGLLPQRQHERSKEQEKIEKQRQMPFHMHVNLELLECAYLVSAMLIEIPYMAAHEFDARRRMISKTFYQNLRASERLALVGPPESMREHVVAAARAMRRGDWRACYKAVVNEKMNAKVWDLMADGDAVRIMLLRLVREECLRTYLFTYSNVYGSIALPVLAEMFELPRERVHSIVSKMIINEELLASMDDPSECVILHRSEPSRLQALALQLTDKVANFVDSNERIFEMKQGAFFQRGGPQGFRGGEGRGPSGNSGGGGRGGESRRGGDNWQRRGQRRHRRDDDRHQEQEAY